MTRLILMFVPFFFTCTSISASSLTAASGRYFMLTDSIIVSAQVFSSGCSGDNSLTVSATGGGGGGYTYSIQCAGSQPIFSSSNVFEGLPPCNYIVTAYSGTMSASTTVTVPPAPSPLGFSTQNNGCSITVYAFGGLQPYSYSINSNGTSGPWSLPQSSNVFDNLSSGLYYVQVVDACGNVLIKNITITGNINLNFSISHTASDICLTNVTGGAGPYSYQLTSSSGTYTSVDGCFSKSLLGCGIYEIKVSGACGSDSYLSQINKLYLNVGCVRFIDGYAELSASGGLPPYQYTVLAGGDEFSNNTGLFEDLTHPVGIYQFSVTDACGNVADQSILPYSPVASLPGMCDESGLLVSIERGCQQSYHFDGPVIVSCNNCGGLRDTVLNTSGSANFPESIPGQTQLLITNSCGDTSFCQDSLILHLFAGCDSIRARIADLFRCDYFAESTSWISDTSAVFELFNSNNELLETSTTGLFKGLTPADGYVVKVHSLTCGELISKIDLLPSQNISIIWDFSVGMGLSGEQCKPTYNLRILRSQGPMLLSGDNGTDILLIDDEHVSYDCNYYYIYTLNPGYYTLSSRLYCAVDSIYLPELPFAVSAIVLSDCPGEGRLEVQGAHDENYWRQFFQNFQLNNWNSTNYVDDNYQIFSLSGDYLGNADGAGGFSYFYNLDAGTYKIVLVFLSCGVDTVVVTIKDQPHLNMVSSQGVICDGQNTGSVALMIKPGRPPYRVRRLNCLNGSYEGFDSGYFIDTLLVVNGLSEGIHCFEVVDSCNNKVKKATGVSCFTDEIQSTYFCDPASIKLQIDSIPFFGYLWINSKGDTLGFNSGLSLKYPIIDTLYQVVVTTPDGCQLSRSITVKPSITPDFILLADRFLCANEDSVLVSAQSSRSGIVYSWPSSNENIVQDWLPEGSHTIWAQDINSGCVLSQTIIIERYPIIKPILSGDITFCEKDTNVLFIENVNNFEQINWGDNFGMSYHLVYEQEEVVLTTIDSLGCFYDTTLYTQMTLLPLVSLNADTTLCPGLTTTIEASVGLNVISFLWSSPSLSSLEAEVGPGVYVLTVVDSFGCSSSASISIFEVEPPEVNLIVSDMVICPGDSTIIIASSNQEVTYKWSYNEYTSNTLVVSSPGEYSVIVTNDKSCKDTALVLITNFISPVIDIQGPEGICGGQDTVLISVLPSNNVSYLWSTGDYGSIIQVSYPGMYEVTVTDNNNCMVSDSFHLSSWDLPYPIILGDVKICEGDTGFLFTGETYQSYKWSIGDTTRIINVDSGIYSVTVTTKAGCTGESDVFEVEKIKLISIVLNAPNQACLGDSITLNIGLSSPEYSGVAFVNGVSGDRYEVPLYDGYGYIKIPMLYSDTFFVDTLKIFDYHCPFISLDTSTINVSTPAVAIEAVTYDNGFNLKCPFDSTGFIKVSMMKGVEPYSFLWSTGESSLLYLDSLTSGVYMITLTDSWGCKAYSQVEVKSPDRLIPLINVIHPKCFEDNTGVLEIDVLNEQYELTCNLNGDLIGSTPVWISNLTSGEYEIGLSDGYCTTFDTILLIRSGSLISVDIPVDRVSIPLGDSFIIPLVITAEQPFSTNFNPDVDYTSGDLPVVTPLSSTKYIISAVDTSGCMASDTIDIIVRMDSLIYFPNTIATQAISSVNKYFTPYVGGQSVKNIEELSIFDRWGSLVFQQKNFLPNIPEKGWDGTFQGKEVEPAVFTWLAQVRLINGDSIPFVGTVTVIR